MAVDLYKTGVSGLQTAQQQLTTTGHNIANVNTDGYSRQRVDQVANPALREGGSYLGTGVSTDTVKRIFDQYAYREQVSTQSTYSHANKLSNKLSGLDQTIATGQQSISSSLSNVYDSLNSLTDTPNDNGVRDLVLSRAQQLSSSMNALKGAYDLEQSSVNGEIEQTATRINELGKDIAKLNVKITQANGSKAKPNDLYDKRDQLVNELSELTTVSTVSHSNGALTVMIGRGQTFVTDDTALALSVRPGNPNTKQTDIFMDGGSAQVKLQSRSLGGELGALFEYRDQDLKQAQADLDRTALSLADNFNQLQAQGLDLNGLTGANFFNDINATQVVRDRAMAYNNNAGSAILGVTVDDTNVLPTSEFELSYDGTNYTLTSRDDGSSQVLGAAGSGPFNTGLGFTIDEQTGTPAAGDRWTLQPTRYGVSNFDVNLQDGAGIAAAGPLDVTPDDDNVSHGRVTVSNITDPAAARALAPITIDVMDDGTGTYNYSIDDGTNPVQTGVYNPPEQTLAWPPAPATAVMDITIAGNPTGEQPNAPETYTINSAFGPGNSANALAMVQTQSRGVLGGGELNFQESLDTTATRVGARAADTATLEESSKAMLSQAQDRVSSVSGVNLDEEAANLIQFQQAYQANARVITVANAIFDALLQAV